MSLNNTEKNSRDLIEKLILDSENIITQESIMWSGMYNGYKNNKKEEGVKDDEGAAKNDESAKNTI